MLSLPHGPWPKCCVSSIGGIEGIQGRVGEGMFVFFANMTKEMLPGWASPSTSSVTGNRHSCWPFVIVSGC